jgi:hypothetical protein
MKISRDVDGLRFVGECNSERGFVPCHIECLRCCRRIDPHAPGGQVSLTCPHCGARGREFWSEAQMDVYLAENWNALREACTHPGVTVMRGP